MQLSSENSKENLTIGRHGRSRWNRFRELEHLIKLILSGTRRQPFGLLTLDVIPHFLVTENFFFIDRTGYRRRRRKRLPA
jgi:hypothetical protein